MRSWEERRGWGLIAKRRGRPVAEAGVLLVYVPVRNSRTPESGAPTTSMRRGLEISMGLGTSMMVELFL